MSETPRETARPVLNATRARQGRWGQQVFWVLVFGTLLAALGLFFAYTWQSEPGTSPTEAERAAAASNFDTPAPPTPALQTPAQPPGPQAP